MTEYLDLKNSARRKFRKAKKNKSVRSEIKELANNFFRSVRKQSYLRKKSKYHEARRARQYCHRQFWKFAKDLLDDDQTSTIKPTISKEVAYNC